MGSTWVRRMRCGGDRVAVVVQAATACQWAPRACWGGQHARARLSAELTSCQKLCRARQRTEPSSLRSGICSCRTQRAGTHRQPCQASQQEGGACAKRPTLTAGGSRAGGAYVCACVHVCVCAGSAKQQRLSVIDLVPGSGCSVPSPLRSTLYCSPDASVTTSLCCLFFCTAHQHRPAARPASRSRIAHQSSSTAAC